MRWTLIGVLRIFSLVVSAYALATVFKEWGPLPSGRIWASRQSCNDRDGMGGQQSKQACAQNANRALGLVKAAEEGLAATWLQTLSPHHSLGDQQLWRVTGHN
mmetsp:Transcript_143799/g.251015  ORF Transcript_143799/g.251015 Transcript_143799/m.251015 type:complete len:103 (-) Transcript_143799:1585-1893(-)